jgi:response regulator RpfG family c-di-GMP phosphodiesterase
MIRSASGSHFDPDVVEAFHGHHDRFDRVRRTMIGA